MMDITSVQPVDTVRAMLTDVLIGFLLGAQVATNVALVLAVMLVVGFAMVIGILGESETFHSGSSCERGVAKPTNGTGLKMKLRDFMVNSLPRVRSRKKQKQQLLLQQQQQQQQQHQANRSRLLNNGDLDENRNTYTSSQLGLSEKDTLHFVRDPSPFRHVSSESIRSELEELKIEKTRFSENVNSVNLNVLTNSYTDSKCLCFKRLTNSYGPNDVILGLGLGHCTEDDSLFTPDHLKQTYSFNTVPKARSKIRTNPWCAPSPKSTPIGSPASSPSPNSSSSNSPSLSPTESRLLRSCDSPAVSEMSTESYSTGSASGNETVTTNACGVQCENGVEIITCHDANTDNTSDLHITSAENDFSSSQSDSQTISTDVTSFNIQNFEHAGCSETGAVTDKKAALDEEQPDQCVSFEYEEVLESLLEDGKAKHGSFASIQDLYEEELDDSYSDCSIGSAGSVGFCKEFALFAESEDSFNFKKPTRCYHLDTQFSAMDFDAHSDAEQDFAYFRTGDYLSDSASSANGDCLSLQSCGKSDQSPGDTATHDATGRSLVEVKASLEEKVLKLRQEKMLVEEKIREAQEEDRIRVREKIRFQKQLTLHRKQILLKTLQELKQKLEQQGTRLQASYSAILNVQRRFSRRSSDLTLITTMGVGAE